METKSIVSKSGDVKVVNAVSTIHKILDEIAVNGKLNCQMSTTQEDVSFVFISNGICVTCHVQELNLQEGAQS